MSLNLMANLFVFSQGHFNASSYYFLPGTGERPWVLDGRTGLPLSKAVGKVQIINAADGATLSPNGNAGVGLTFDGVFIINGLVVPGVPGGGTADVIVRAWDASTGTTWADATCRSAPNSGWVTVTRLGSGLGPSATFRDDSNFAGLEVSPVPEPSTVALSALGVVGVFLAVRRGAGGPKGQGIHAGRLLPSGTGNSSSPVTGTCRSRIYRQ